MKYTLRTILRVTELLTTVGIEQTVNAGCIFYLRFHHYGVFIAILCYIRIQRRKKMKNHGDISEIPS